MRFSILAMCSIIFAIVFAEKNDNNPTIQTGDNSSGKQLEKLLILASKEQQIDKSSNRLGSKKKRCFICNCLLFLNCYYG